MELRPEQIMPPPGIYDVPAETYHAWVALKPCPCCGSVARITGWRDPPSILFAYAQAECTNDHCGLMTDLCVGDTIEEAKATAASIWNRRTDDGANNLRNVKIPH